MLMRISTLRLLPLCAGAIALAGCATPPETPPTARVQLWASSGSQASGVVTFTPRGDAVLVVARVSGLTPGEHGFHVHEVGDCSAPDASSAKGHFNPGGVMHGYYQHAEHHAGDLPNLVANASGVANYRAEVRGLQLDTGPNGILGRSVIVHANADDYRSQPAGNSGMRVACGVIERS